MIATVTTASFGGALVILGLVTLLQSSGASAEFDVKAHHDLKCLFGPMYWCKSMSNAVNCKAIEHCTRTSWRTQNPPEDVQGISCMFCTRGMDVVMREVKKHYTQDQVVNKIGKMCDMFFTGAKEANCRSKIDEILPIIMDSANEVVTSQSLCFTLGFCLTPLDPLGNEKKVTNSKAVNIDIEVHEEHEIQKSVQPSMLQYILFRKDSPFIDPVFRKILAMDDVDPITLLFEPVTQKPEESVIIIDYKLEKQPSIFDALFRKVHAKDNVEPITLMYEENKQKSEESITVLNSY